MKIEYEIWLKKCTLCPFKIHSNMCSILHKPTLVIDQPKEVIALFNHFFLKNKYGDNIKNLGARVASCFHKGGRKGVQIPT